MKRIGMCGVSVLGVIGLAHAAEAAPAWCEALEGHKVTQEHGVDSMLDEKEPRWVLPDLVAASCTPRADAAQRQEEVGELRAEWSKKLGLTEADWRDVADYALLDQTTRNNGELRLLGDDAAKRPWSKFDPIDQYATLREGAGISGSLELDHNFFADALGTRLTETGRLGYVLDCIGRGTTVEPERWAMCQGDVERLDLSKIPGELRGSTHPGGDKIRIRIAVMEAAEPLAAHAAQVKKLIASDPGYARMFEIAKTTREEWAGRYQKDAALLALVSKTEDARRSRSRQASAGCAEETRAAWKAAASNMPASAFANLSIADSSFEDRVVGIMLNDPEVYLATVAMANCAHDRDREELDSYIEEKVERQLHFWPGARGPRTQAMSAILTGGVEFDDRALQVRQPSVDRSFGTNGKSPAGGGGRGIIAKLTPQGDKVLVTFKPDLFKEQRCDAWKYSNRVVQISSDGSLVYDATCQKMITVTLDKSSKPTTVAADQMAGITKGMYVAITSDTLLYASPKPNAPATHIFGVKLK
ncbi:MAG: hypothetical protein K8W52_38060 [Deltaproteobacteria bacterium]|nr:hypothetical protein [Deltaproteobacteria bacterium]